MIKLMKLSLFCLLFPHFTDGFAQNQAESDQERCHKEASYMAKYGIRGHVGTNIGSFEGVGWGNSPHVPTCTPKRALRLTGDASVRAANGIWYRVRSWR
jgi:hypothetical protein